VQASRNEQVPEENFLIPVGSRIEDESVCQLKTQAAGGCSSS
jgi:hypothetical protein